MTKSNKQIFIDIIHMMENKQFSIGYKKRYIRHLHRNGFNFNTKYLRGKTLGHYCVKYDLPQLISFFYKLGTNFNICDDAYDAPLHKAARENNIKIIKELIKIKVDLNIPAEFEETALHIAVSEGHLEATKILLLSGADASLVDEQNRTPLDYALADHNEALVNLFKNYKKK